MTGSATFTRSIKYHPATRTLWARTSIRETHSPDRRPESASGERCSVKLNLARERTWSESLFEQHDGAFSEENNVTQAQIVATFATFCDRNIWFL